MNDGRYANSPQRSPANEPEHVLLRALVDAEKKRFPTAEVSTNANERKAPDEPLRINIQFKKDCGACLVYDKEDDLLALSELGDAYKVKPKNIRDTFLYKKLSTAVEATFQLANCLSAKESFEYNLNKDKGVFYGQDWTNFEANLTAIGIAPVRCIEESSLSTVEFYIPAESELISNTLAYVAGKDEVRKKMEGNFKRVLGEKYESRFLDEYFASIDFKEFMDRSTSEGITSIAEANRPPNIDSLSRHGE